MSINVELSAQAAVAVELATQGPLEVELLPDHRLGQHVDFDDSNIVTGNVLTRQSDGTFAMEGVPGGISTFLGLSDTPASYAGAALQVVRVNAGLTALEFAAVGAGDMTAAVYDPAAITEQLVGLTAVQTITGKSIVATQIDSGTLPDARIQISGVTQHETSINHDVLLNFAAGEHVLHSGVVLTAGVGLTGGGAIDVSRTFDLDINGLTTETAVDPAADFVAIYDVGAAAHRKVLVEDFAATLIGTGATEYRFSTSTTDADPGAGNFRFNNAVLASVTQIFIDDVNNDGVDISIILSQITAGNRIYVQQADDPTKAVLFDVTGASVDGTGYWRLPVAHSADAGGGLMDNNRRCVIVIGGNANLAFTDLTDVSATTGAGSIGIFNNNPTLIGATWTGNETRINSTHEFDLAAGTISVYTLTNTGAGAQANLVVDGFLTLTGATAFSTQLQTAPTAARVWTIQDATDTFVGRDTTDTLTSKTLTTPTIAAAGWTNANHTHAGATTGGTIAIADTTGTLAIARGGTGQTTQTAAFDALSPLTTAGDLIYHNGSDNVRRAIGTADQVLRVNGAANAPEWYTPVSSPKTINIESPTSSEDASFWRTPVAITVTSVVGVLRGSATPTVTVSLMHNTNRSSAGLNVFAAARAVTSTTTGDTLTLGGDVTIPANSFIWLESSAQGGTVLELELDMYFTVD